jgi:hypothetical protein
MARPREYDREAIAIAFESYVAETEIPIIAEFAARLGLSKQFMFDCEEFSGLIKACTTKKEAALERQALGGKVNCTMAIFSLKQLGWKDTHEQTHKTDGPIQYQVFPSDIPIHRETG